MAKMKDKDRLRIDIDKVMKEMDAVKKIGSVKTKDGVLPAIMGICDTRVVTPKDITVRGRKGCGIKGKTTGRAYRCRMDGCPGWRITVRWEDGTLTHPCSKGMLLSKKGWRIL